MPVISTVAKRKGKSLQGPARDGWLHVPPAAQAPGVTRRTTLAKVSGAAPALPLGSRPGARHHRRAVVAGRWAWPYMAEIFSRPSLFDTRPFVLKKSFPTANRE